MARRGLAFSWEGCSARGTGREIPGVSRGPGTLGDTWGLSGTPGADTAGGARAGSKVEGRYGDCQVRARVAAVSKGRPAIGASFRKRRD